MDEKIKLKIVDRYNRRKIENKNYSIYSKEDTIKYLEDMALNGWLLEKVLGHTYYFREIEPCKIRYDMVVCEEKDIEMIYVRQKNEDINGWNYICTYELIMYVYTTNEDTDYMENDKKSILEKIVKRYQGFEFKPKRLSFLIGVFLVLVSLPYMRDCNIDRIVEEFMSRGINYVWYFALALISLLSVVYRNRLFVSMNKDATGKIYYLKEEQEKKISNISITLYVVISVIYAVLKFIYDRDGLKIIVITIGIVLLIFYGPRFIKNKRQAKIKV